MSDETHVPAIICVACAGLCLALPAIASRFDPGVVSCCRLAARRPTWTAAITAGLAAHLYHTWRHP